MDSELQLGESHFQKYVGQPDLPGPVPLFRQIAMGCAACSLAPWGERAAVLPLVLNHFFPHTARQQKGP